MGDKNRHAGKLHDCGGFPPSLFASDVVDEHLVSFQKVLLSGGSLRRLGRVVFEFLPGKDDQVFDVRVGKVHRNGSVGRMSVLIPLVERHHEMVNGFRIHPFEGAKDREEVAFLESQVSHRRIGRNGFVFRMPLVQFLQQATVELG